MLDNLGGVRDMIDRLGVPPRIKAIVTKIEEDGKTKIDQPPEIGIIEVRELFQLVDGQALIGCIVAHMIGSVPEEAIEQPPADGTDKPDGEGDEEGTLSDDEVHQILAHNLDDLPAALDGWDQPVLLQLRAAEEAKGEDQTRVGALELIDKAIAAQS